MKTTKRLLSCLLVLAMVFALAIPVFAAGDCTITITNATIGATYKVYKVFDATSNTETDDDNNTVTNYAYTIKDDNPWFEYVKDANGVYKSPFELVEINDMDGGTGEYNVRFKDSVKEEDREQAVIDFFNSSEIKALMDNNTIPSTDSKKAGSDEVEFKNLAYGYYVVSSTVGKGVVSLTPISTDAKIIDKNQEPGDPHKEVTNGANIEVTGKDEAGENVTIPTVEINKPFTFEITYIVTKNHENRTITDYTVTDEMGNGMVLVGEGDKVVAADIKVELLDVDPDSDDDYTALLAGHYTVDINADKDGFTVKITDWDKIANLPSSAKLVITYKAMLTEGAAINGDGVTNTAKIEHDCEPEETEKPHEVTKTVYTYALAIQKMDEKGNGLKDAKFEVTDINGDPVNVKATEKPGVYVVDPDSGSNEVVSPAGGLIIIKGVSNQEYTLTETAAPNGYNLATEPATVTPTKTTATTTTTWIDKDGNVTKTETENYTYVDTNEIPVELISVVNMTGVELPSTGGIGTTLFYVIGGAMVLAALVVLVTKKRMGDKQ